jgi:hypothetical protein
LLESSWLFHGVPHKPNSSRFESLSQVYYCPSLAHTRPS